MYIYVQLDRRTRMSDNLGNLEKGEPFASSRAIRSAYTTSIEVESCLSIWRPEMPFLTCDVKCNSSTVRLYTYTVGRVLIARV